MLRPTRSIQKFRHGEQGSVAIMFAAALVVVVGSLAAAIDLTYTATVSSDLRHVGKSICGRAVSAMNRGKSGEQVENLSRRLGDELITKTSLNSKDAAFNVNINGSTGQVSVAGKATVTTPFISVFGIKSLQPKDTIECNGPVPPPAPPPAATPPPASGNSNCGSSIAAVAGPQYNAINSGPGNSSNTFSNNSSQGQNNNSNSGQGNAYANGRENVNSNNGNGNSANASGGYTGTSGSTQGGATTSNLGASSYSCSNAQTTNSFGSSFSGSSASGPGATAVSSTYSSASSNGGGSSGGGFGAGPNGGSGGGGGSFCVGAGC